ncbi:c(7)-type cytochrome triheme domain-containing protein [Pelobacter seleniigenes]|uniref:c(7)-type cytochrome triheme domain-containing protein n=1 Tax=Pelobacter seleniigenes TaxID=407188 RepID=UPI000A04302B
MTITKLKRCRKITEPEDCTGIVIFAIGLWEQGTNRQYGYPSENKKVTMDAMSEGESCGTCHEGSTAFSVEGDCESCHQMEPSAPSFPVRMRESLSP